jgi:VanZ family protein
MREFYFPKFWLGIWIFGWCLCITLSLINPPDVGVQIDNGDKIGHFLAYATLSAWAVMVFQNRRAQLLAACGLFTLGLLMEWLQGTLTVYRMMDMRDAMANTVGVLIGLCVSFTPLQRFLQYCDQRLRSKRLVN